MNVLLEVIALLAVAVLSNGLEKQKYRIYDNNVIYKFFRRFMDLPSSSVVIGAPSYPSHLPEAEPILPGHTLIRPGLGMLKSALKFPHRELEGGSGVYGNEDNLGIRYNGKHERVLYTGARRMSTDKTSGIVLIIPKKSRDGKRTDVKQFIKQLSVSEIQGPPLLKTAQWQPLKNPTVHLRVRKADPTASNLRNSTSREENTELKVDLMTFSKKLPTWPNFMGHYRKHSNVMQKILETLLRHDGKRRQQAPVASKPKDADNSDEEDTENINLMKSVEATFDVESQTAMPRKQELFWKSKDLFTHIKIDQHAPEYRDFLPNNIEAEDVDGIRNWWFYNQVDHKEITDNDD